MSGSGSQSLQKGTGPLPKAFTYRSSNVSRRPREPRWSLESLRNSVHKRGVGRRRRGGGGGNTQRSLLLPDPRCPSST